MSYQFYMCPRIRLTKTDGTRAILPIDAISGIDEDKRSKCVHVNTMDGFTYDVVNPITEVDKKICEELIKSNSAIPVASPLVTLTESTALPQVTINENTKAAKFKKRRLLSAAIDKPARRIKALEEGGSQDRTPTPSPHNEEPETGDTSDAN